MLNRFLSLTIVFSLFLSGASALGQQSLKQPATLEVGYGKNLNCYYAVMGHVEKPGVYEFLAPCANLEELIARTGGLKESASGNLKIVHADGSESQAFYSTHSEQKLLPNDIVFVAGIVGKSQSGILSRRSNSHAHIGLINLVDRPVVLKFRDVRLTLGRLLNDLNQQPELAKSLRIIRPNDSTSQKKGESSERLAEGSIIVFNPGTVQRQNLLFHPEFKPADSPRVFTRNDRQQIDSATASAKKRMSKPRLSGSEVKYNDLQPASGKPPDGRLTSQAPNWANEDSAARHGYNKTNSDDIAIRAVGAGNSFTSESSSTADAVLDDVEPVRVLSASKKSTPIWKQRAVLGILGSVMLFSGYLLWSISRSTGSIKQNQQRKSQARNVLKELIEDAIPVVSMEVPHPGNFNLFESSASKKIFRIDVAHQIRRPHFLPRETKPDDKQDINQDVKQDAAKPTIETQNEIRQPAESVPAPIRYDTIMPPEDSLQITDVVEPETETLSSPTEKERHEVRAPHFLKKNHTPSAFQPHSQQDDYIQRVLKRVREEEQK